MEWNTWMHIMGATGGLILGAVVVLLPKLGKQHRWLGYGYLVSMVAVNLSALTMYRQSGDFGPFHILALISLAGLTVGYGEALRRRPGWLIRHGVWMSWSYVGLIAAGISQVVSSYIWIDSALGVIAVSTVTVIIGGALIFTLVPRAIRNLSGRNRARTRSNASLAR